MHRHTNSGIPTGIGDGESENAPSPASPDGDEFWSAKLPAGSKNLPFTSPNRGIPRRGSGIGAPLPSLVGAVWMSVGGPNVGIGMGRHGVSDKKNYVFGRNAPQIAILWSLHLFVVTQPYGWVRREG
jgi:hypothetical protein